MIEYGLSNYIHENYNPLLKPYLVQKENGKKKHTPGTAYEELKNRLKIQYFQ
jgi:hypothetical protein